MPVEEQEEEPEPFVDEEGARMREEILQSIQQFKGTVEEMKNLKQQHLETKKQRIQERKAVKRTEKLFTQKIEGLSKKVEFNSTIPSQ